MKRLIIGVVFICLFLSSISPINAYYTNMPASVVIGQPDFTSGTANQGISVNATTLNNPRNTILIGQKMIIPDFSNNRVLIYNSIPTTNNAPANIVIGQPDMVSSSANQGGSAGPNTLSTPEYVATDGTKLFVSDYGNHRVLIYNNLPTTNNASADVVIGQQNFSGSSANQGGSVTAATLKNPVGIAINGQNLFIADSNNNRVLIYNTIPTTNNTSADIVLGQADFSSGSANRGTGVAGANTFNNPFGLSINNNKLIVADTSNRRVLIWNSIPTTNGASADVVLGQPNFVSNSANQGQANPSANTLRGPQDAQYVNNRLFVADTTNSRVLIYNSVPTSNNASADVVLGQTDFTHGSSLSTSATSFQNQFIHVEGNTLFLNDALNHRILIFNNVISSPQMNISLPLTPLNDGTGRLRVYGSVQLGERPNYALQWVKAEVNGGGLGYVSNLGGGRDNGTNQTLYDFYNDFNPGSILNSDINNFTLLLVASSFNADTVSLFYFQPFVLNSVSSGTFNFSVNKYQIQKIKDNVDHFEVWVRSSTSSLWIEYISNISPGLIDTNTGQVTVSGSTPGISFPNSVLPGTYDVKVRSVSKNGNSGFDTNTVSGVTLTGTNSISTSISQGMVLQINSMGGNDSILSSFNPGNIKTNYGVSGFNPTVKGISWANSFITLSITNKNNTNEFKTYTTKVNPDSSFSLFPSLYTNSILNFTVTKDGMYNFIPSFDLNTGQ